MVVVTVNHRLNALRLSLSARPFPRQRQCRAARPDPRAPMGAAEHRGVRRRSRQCHGVRPVGRRREDRDADGDARGQGAVPQGDHDERAAGHRLGADQRANAARGRFSPSSGKGVDPATAPVEKLVAALSATDPILGGGVYMGPVLDMRNLSRHPFWPDAAPQSLHIPMMMGNTVAETRAFLPADGPQAGGAELGQSRRADRAGNDDRYRRRLGRRRSSARAIRTTRPSSCSMRRPRPARAGAGR